MFEQLTKYPSAVVYATMRDVTKISPQLQTQATENDGRLVILEADVARPSSVAKLRETITQSTKTLDQVIYNAGVLKGFGSLTSAGLDPRKVNITVDLFGPYTTALEFIPFVRASEYSNKVMVLIGSSFGSITTAQEDFEQHGVWFGDKGVNATAAYDISKVRTNSKPYIVGIFHFQDVDIVLRRPKNVWLWNLIWNFVRPGSRSFSSTQAFRRLT